jgi:hypothetical protein
MTTLNTSCSENIMVLSQGEGFSMHVFSSLLPNFKRATLQANLACEITVLIFTIFTKIKGWDYTNAYIW